MVRMTERFTIDYVAGFILDTQDIDEYGGETFYDTTEDRIDDLCTLLNNLHDEVEELKEYNKQLQEAIKELVTLHVKESFSLKELVNDGD